MSGCFELARPVECSRAGFEYDCAPIDLRDDREELVAHHSALARSKTAEARAVY
jgi:hypothetical protein